MSLNEYIVLLWLSVYGDLPCSEHWVMNALDSLESHNMVARSEAKTKILERGRVLIEHLKTVPLPVTKYVMP